jgi:DNA-directed RNA polymerase subunit RPC12/RpoP
MIDFWCKNCGNTMKAHDKDAGKNCKCPNCEKIMTVPTPLIAEPAEKSKSVPAHISTPSESPPESLPTALLAPVGSDKDKIKYKCPECGEKLENTGSMGGLDDKCPLCGNVHSVPLSKSQKKAIREQEAQEEEQLRQQRRSEIREDEEQATASTIPLESLFPPAVSPLQITEILLPPDDNSDLPPKPTPSSRTQGLPSLLVTIAGLCWFLALVLLVFGFYLLEHGKTPEPGIQLMTLAFIGAWGGIVVLWMSHVLSCLRDTSRQTRRSMTYLQHIDEKLTQSLLNQKQTDTDNPDSSA